MKKLIILLNILIFCFGCELIDIHPYDVHVTGDTNINTNNVKRIEKLCSKKTFSVLPLLAILNEITMKQKNL